VRHPDGFYGNHRVEAWPFLQRWEAFSVIRRNFGR